MGLVSTMSVRLSSRFLTRGPWAVYMIAKLPAQRPKRGSIIAADLPLDRLDRALVGDMMRTIGFIRITGLPG